MFNWVPMVMFVIALITRGIAFLPIQHILLAELFPTEIRTLSVGIVQFFETGTGASGDWGQTQPDQPEHHRKPSCKYLSESE